MVRRGWGQAGQVRARAAGALGAWARRRRPAMATAGCQGQAVQSGSGAGGGPLPPGDREDKGLVPETGQGGKSSG